MSGFDDFKKQISKLTANFPVIPILPSRVEKKLDDSVMRGLMVSERNRYLLLNQIKTGGYSWGSADYGFILEDPSLKTNSTRRRLMVIDKTREGFRASLNKSLSGGGGGNPVLDTLLGLAMGFVSGPAGVVWTGITTVLAFSNRDQQPVRVRNGDEIHHIEVIGMNGSKLEHMELIILVDPYRVKAKRDIQQWIIHDKRTKIIFP
ncbi:hypothetical protein [Eudoraea adriatica]|uniref:hypothetical protein n=1 Tax=Eudoraea adriatica TaxID=446681 RepID=UPI00037B61EE|nr:hypothetical protein [Eudoraea adriatica]